MRGERMMPGLYDDNGTLNIDVPELLRACGKAVTPENIERLTETAIKMVRESYPDIDVRIVKPL